MALFLLSEPYREIVLKQTKHLQLLYFNSAQNTSVNWIIRLLLALLCWPKVILLSGGHYINFAQYLKYVTQKLLSPLNTNFVIWKFVL